MVLYPRTGVAGCSTSGMTSSLLRIPGNKSRSPQDSSAAARMPEHSADSPKSVISRHFESLPASRPVDKHRTRETHLVTINHLIVAMAGFFVHEISGKNVGASSGT